MAQVNIKKWSFPIAYFLFVIAFLFFFSTSGIVNKYGGFDFLAYLTGAEIVKHDNPKNLYNSETQKYFQMKLAGKPNTDTDLPDKFLSYRNPPITAYMFLPFTFLNFEQAFLSYALISSMFTILAIYLIWGKNAVPIELILFVPIFISVSQGQISSLMLLVLVLGYKYRHKPFIAGLLCGILFLKIQWMVFCLYFVLRLKSQNKLKYIFGLASSTIGLVLVNSFMYGASFLTDYLNFLVSSENNRLGTSLFVNFNIHSIYSVLTGATEIDKILMLIGLVVFVVASFLVEKLINRKGTIKPEMEIAVFSVVIFLGLLFNAHTMPVELIALLIPLNTGYILNRLGKSSLGNKAYMLILYLVPYVTFLRLQWIGVIFLFVGVILLVKNILNTESLYLDRA